MMSNSKEKITCNKLNKTAFTLVEMLLVLAIMGIITAITIPRLGGVLKGSRLKSASRAVIRLGRYARSMAVLHQVPTVVVFDMDCGEIAVTVAKLNISSNRQQNAENYQQTIETRDFDIEGKKEDEERDWGMKVKLDHVRITSVSYGDNGKNVETGKCSIVYETNGQCVPYSVKLENGDGRTTVIDFDFISSAKVKTDKDI